jgi:ferrous iron transport protein A
VIFLLYPLSQLKPGQHSEICWLSDHKPISRRLADLGFEPGTPVSCLLQKSRGSISAFLIRGAVIALRREDSDLVFVQDPSDQRKGGFHETDS